ncbi:PA14 domain-containing protein [Haloferula sargassicola]|uniref:PA14 domain-containing protein n=1 Tax=Haloferula sargassicola TaxID=490096 RepID=A0ABP9US73_9BACT
MKLKTLPLLVALGGGSIALFFGTRPQPQARHAEHEPAAVEQPTPAARIDRGVTDPTAVATEAAGLFDRIGSLEKDAIIRLPLADGSVVDARVNYVRTVGNGATIAGGRLAGRDDIYQIAREPWGYRGFILRRDEGIAYVYGSADDGRLTVARRPLGEVICEPDPNWQPMTRNDAPEPQEIPIYNDGRSVGVLAEPIPILSSLPRAKGVIYLDFDGEVIEGHAWEGGARIVAPAYRFTAERVEEIWKEVAENYAPFEVNVTTDLQAYLRAPEGLRIHCITTSNNFAGAGGVAFNNTFRESGSPVCWNFDSNSGASLVISHETGHTFGLSHDGTSSAGYYDGHGNWGPIMGAPYGKPINHWSKGDYNDANEHQDDIAIIGTSVPERADESQDTSTPVKPFVLGSGGSVDQSGVIINRYDVDRYAFTTTGGPVSLHFENADRLPDLDIEAKLFSSTGSVIATSSPTDRLTADLSATLGAGTYTVTVDGVGNGSWASNGYDDYGSIGQYRITGSIASAVWAFQVDPTSLNGAAVGIVDPGNSSYSIRAGNTDSAFSISSSTGLIRVANAAALTAGAAFDLTVRYSKNGSSANQTVHLDVAPAYGLKYELWTNLGGSGIGGLTGDARYPNQPTISGRAPTFQAVYPADNYGQKLSGYLVPDETGNHVFWTSADDASELWLSTDANPANKVRVAFNSSDTGAGSWSQPSANIPLVAGQRYYVEFLSRENWGGDHASAAWQTPSQPRQLIANKNLEYPGTPANRAPWIASRTYRVRENATAGTVIATLDAADYEPGSVLSGWTITGGNTGNAFALDAGSGELRVNGALSFATLPVYHLDVTVTDSGGLATAAQIAIEVEPLAVKREYWSNIGGNAISDLTSDPDYPNHPDLVTYETHFETAENSADNYGQRLTGYLRAPDTGNYTFWIASDDFGELWLSTDTNPANKQRIAYHTGATGFREWGKYATQQSATITLESGKFYYIEALQKEGVGGDSLSVAWQGPNFDRTVLGAPHVTQEFYNHGAPQLDNLAVTIFDRDVGVTLATLDAPDWADPGTTVRYSITDGNTDGAFEIDELTGELRMVTGPLPAGTRVLTVTATDNSPTPLSDSATVTVTIARPALKREVWTGLSGGQSLGDLTSSLYFPGNPQVTGYTASFEAPSGWGDNYGQRMSGFLIPPATGDYTFWIASDDGGELRLSTDANPANRRKLCQVTGSVNARDWTAQSGQQSSTISLVAGQRYYIEALQKEGVGGDHLAVAWQGPGFGRQVISGSYLDYPDQFRPGLRRELWFGGDWNNFPDSSTADFRGTIVDAKAPSDVGDDYLQKLSGYLVPPATGTYRFWIASDDDSTLSLSTDDTAANLVQIAYLTGYVEPEAWDTQTSQRSAARRLVAGQRYYFEVRHHDGIGGDHVAVAWQGPGFARKLITHESLETPDAPADRTRLKLERWTGVTGNNVSDLTSLAAFPAAPSETTTLPAQSGLKANTAAGDNYGQRISGYLVAPETGRYTFWIASDDQSQLWISTSDNPANRVLAAQATGATGEQAWDVQPGQKSVPLALVAGDRYYLEVLHKEGGGNDYVAVAWQGPGFARQLLQNPYLEHFDSIPGIPSLRRETWSGIAGGAVSNLTGNAAYQSGVPETRGILTAFEAPSGFTDHYGQRVSALLRVPETGNYRFWIAADDGSELWLSPDEERDHRLLLASTPDFTDFRQWDKFPSQASGVLPLVAGADYYIEALQKDDLHGDHLSVAWEGPSFARTILDGRFLTYPGAPPEVAALRREVWTGIGGNEISYLTNDAGYPDSPDLVESLDSFQTPQDWGENYGQRVYGYLIAPRDGDYTFWIASDDDSELWLSTTGDPAARTRIAWADSATGYENYDNFSSQTSATITLAAGQRCYIEALGKEGVGGDYLSVAWAGPGFDRRVIEGTFLEYPRLLPGETVPGTAPNSISLDPGFAFWLDSKGLAGADRLATADPDGNGLSNALEFVLGGDPASPSDAAAGLLPDFETEGDWTTFTFRRTAVSEASGPHAELSAGLGDWTTPVDGVGNVTISVEKDAFGTGIDRVTVRVPASGTKLFMRLVTGF